jgi:hypothetical protein
LIDATWRRTSPPPAYRILRYAALAYAVGFLLHTADHFRRGLEVLTPEVLWAGSVSGVVAVAAIGLALVGHGLAPLIAVAHGLSQGLGVAAVHLLPRWGTFSDSLPDGGADALSWAAVLLEIAAALAFGAAGVYVLRRGTRRAVARDEPAGHRDRTALARPEGP